MIRCAFCSKVFKNPSILNCHMVMHTKEKPHKCHICPAAFGFIQSLKQHIKSVHDGTKRIKNTNCPLCSYKCRDKTELQLNLPTHSADKPFSCSIPSCGFKTKHENYLQQHVRVVHNNEHPYECPSAGCSYRAKTIGHLRSHLKTHIDEKPFTCKAQGCSYRCKFKDRLKAHTSSVHSDEKPFKCSICEFRSKHRSSLMTHVNTHNKIKRYQCQAPYCGFASHQKGKLKLHLDRKHGKKNVLCNEPGCNFKCGSINVLKEHLICHKKPMLKCPMDSCNFSTRFKRPLASHVTLRHEDSLSEGNDQDQGKHVCTFCSSRFTKSSRLQYHLKRHTGEKPHRCSFCQYTTACSLKLRVHASTVHSISVVPRGKEDEVKQCVTCSRFFGVTASSCFIL